MSPAAAATQSSATEGQSMLYPKVLVFESMAAGRTRFPSLCFGRTSP